MLSLKLEMIMFLVLYIIFVLLWLNTFRGIHPLANKVMSDKTTNKVNLSFVTSGVFAL